jgi:hypothetical protein
VNAGSIVIMPEATMAHAGWSGESYIALDDQGNGAYMLSSGDAGGRKLMNMMTSSPAVRKPLLSDLRQSLDDWLKKQGTSYSKVVRELGFGGGCTASVSPGLFHDLKHLAYSLLNRFVGLFASEAEAELCSAVAGGIVAGAELLPLFVVMAMVMSKALENATETIRERVNEERWESFIHITDCNGLYGIRVSHLIRPTMFGDFGYGVYLAHDLYGRKFPDDAAFIRQMFNIPGAVESFGEIEVNVNRVWLTYHPNKNPVWAGAVEVVARVFGGLDLALPHEAHEIQYHFEYCAGHPQ